ncbi:MAG: PQQ-binding-like beta-propeller repeat protein [Acidobacteria bacterium]|nr:PQQ-binding-like beta-propeller repeat protein [Acidobacteriota bacterium]
MKILLVSLLFTQVALGQVSYERLLRAEAEPGNWLTYSGNYRGHRHSALKQINAANVARLRPVWVYQSRDPGKFSTSPIVVDGVVYITERPNIVTALDAGSGKSLWHFPTGGPIYANPISFLVDEKQYVTIAAGNALFAFALDY